MHGCNGWICWNDDVEHHIFQSEVDRCEMPRCPPRVKCFRILEFLSGTVGAAAARLGA